jgi:hypothetical protein
MLHFQQAMPLFTQEKWERMFQEGKTCFLLSLQPQLEEWLSSWCKPIHASGEIQLFSLRPVPPLPPTSCVREEGRKHNLRGIATGWVDVLGGYSVWALLFIYRFIFHNPF